MTQRKRGFIGLLLLAALVGAAWGLLHGGVYGLTLFILLPVLLGALTTWVFRPKTPARAAGMGVLAAMAASCSLLLLGMEGIICIAMTLPLACPLGALGSWLMFRCLRSYLRTNTVGMLLLLLPSSLVWDSTAKPPTFEVRSAITINAAPERVWKYVVSFPDLPEPREWYFRSGLAYPTRTRIEGTGVGAVRSCEFSTGWLKEPVEVWDEPHLLRFRVVGSTAPMREWSPYGEIVTKHLHEYLVSKRGQFRLTRLDGDRTLLEGTSWYQHGLWPAEYWRRWSDAIIHRIHTRVLTHIQTLAEAEAH